MTGQGQGFLASFTDAAAAVNGGGPHGAHAHARTRSNSDPLPPAVPEGASPWAEFYAGDLRRLGKRAEGRLTAHCDRLWALSQTDPRQAVLRAGQLVAAELVKLSGTSPERAAELRADVTRKLLGLAIEIAGLRPARAPARTRSRRGARNAV